MHSYYMFVCVISILMVLFSFYFDWLFWKTGTETLGMSPIDNSDIKTVLFVGIMSSRDHFRQRQSQRQTWLKLLPSTFHYRFVVGEKTCKIHPLDRKSLFSCEDLNYTIPKNITEEYLLYANSVNSPERCNNHFDNIGFSFHVHHPIMVNYLGLRKSNDMLKKDLLAKVVLENLQTSEQVTSVKFDHDSLLKDVNKKDYIFMKLTTPVILPKGFEGVVKVEKMIENFQVEIYKESAEWTHGNLFSVLNLITENSSQISTSYCGQTTFSFTIKEVDKLYSHIREKQLRHSEWSYHIEETRTQLENEAEQFKDIVFVNVVDTYRNLPKKVLELIKWVHTNARAKYILKTDDDTFIDIKRVEVELNNTSGWHWWSCFRVGWPVKKYGKWRETAYQQNVYPLFPSGAGYVLSKGTVAWLNERKENLSTSYQGEDVAMGIWLEGMNASAHVGSECYWACNEQCHSLTCNAMELSVNDVYKMWETFQQCGNKICHCPSPS